jgi:hypothetical protein
MPIYKMGEMGDIGRRLGTTMIFTAVGGLCGPPISGAIKGPSGDLKFMSYYAGVWYQLDLLSPSRITWSYDLTWGYIYAGADCDLLV